MQNFLFPNIIIINYIECWKKSSAQITSYYTKEDLVGKQIIANVNFEEKQIANFKSQCLVLGSVDKGGVVLLNPSQKVPNGSSVQ